MFCPKCGSDNADGSNYCMSCGASLSKVTRKRNRLSDWDVTHWLVLVLSVLSLFCLFTNWFEIQYLGLLTDKARFSAFGALASAGKIAIKSYFGLFDPIADAYDLLLSEVLSPILPFLAGMGVCVVLFVYGIVEFLTDELANFFCAAAAISVLLVGVMAFSFLGNDLLVLTEWIWVFLLLCVFDLLTFFLFTARK